MPSLYAHYLLGEKTIPMLNTTLQAIIREHRAVFDVGLQGPDIFFYGSIFGPKSITKFGSEMHGKAVRESLLPMTESLLERKALKDACLAYILGFIGHFSLDATSHPYIFSIQDSIESHLSLESDFDALLLREKSIIPWKYHFEQHVKTTKADREAIANVYLPFSDRVSEKDVHSSIKSMYAIRKVLRTPNRLKFRFLRTGMKALGFYNTYYSMLQIPPEKGKGQALLWPEQPEDALDNLREQHNKAQEQFKENIENYIAYTKQESTLDAFFNRNFEEEGEKGI